MTDPKEKRLGPLFVGWVTDLPPEEVVRRYRAMPHDDRMDVEGYAFEQSATALNSDDPHSERFEILARCFDIFAEAEDEDTPPFLSSTDLLRRKAHALRHPTEWREEQAAEARRNQIPERRLHALALASSCLADEPDDVRLRRIEEVLPELTRLASQAAAEGKLAEQSAIGEDIVGLWKLRDALREGS